MAVSERARHDLYETARRALSDDAADTLMELLPPVGWADVATKHDLHELEGRLDARFERMDARFEAIETSLNTTIDAKVNGAVTRLIMWIVPLNIGLAFGAAHLA